MSEFQDNLKIKPTWSMFNTDDFKSIEYLNLEFVSNFLPFQKTGIDLCSEIVKIVPSNFPQIYFLDLEASCYEHKKDILEVAVEPLFGTNSDSEIVTQLCTDSDSELGSELDSELDSETYSEVELEFEINSLPNTERDSKTWSMPQILIKENIEFHSSLNAYIYRARKYGYDYKGLIVANRVYHVIPACPVLESFLSGKSKRMRIYLTHGFQRIPTSSVIDFCRRGDFSLSYLKFFVLETLEFYNLFIRLPNLHWETYAVHRAFMVIEMVFMLCNILFSVCNHDSSAYKTCCLLLWRAIPDPYLSQGEIREILSTLAMDTIDNVINNICLHYTRTLPEITVKTITPRSLKHLCRCTIRHCIRLRYELPKGIDQLRLPLKLKNFINLES